MNYFELISKVIIIFFVLIVLLRVLGKREVGQLSIFDLVILLIIADISSLGLDNSKFFIPSIICLFVLALLQKLLSIILLKFTSLRGICDGKPTILVYDGKINIKNMRKELYSIDDLVSQMRGLNAMDIKCIKLAVLETSGRLSIFTNNDYQSVSLPIIISGIFIKEAFDNQMLNIDKIKNYFNKKNLKIKKIIYASLNENELTYYYLNNNKIEVIEANTELL